MKCFNRIFYSEMARVSSLVLLTLLLTFPAQAQNSNDTSSDCAAEQGITYLCGFLFPEDIVNVGSTGLVLASGGFGPGLVYLIDPVSGTRSELINNGAFTMRHDSSAWPECPGPLNLEAFDVHGLSLREISPGRFSIYSTSHGEREAIEIYELDLRGNDQGATPVLTWTGCVLLQQDGHHNSVAQLADGGFVTTRMIDRSASRGRPWGGITGQVFEWHPGGQLSPVAGTELSMPNGIEVSMDQRYIYVAVSGTDELVRFDRNATPIAKLSVSTPMTPDNVHWDSNGKLVIAGPHEDDPVTCGQPRCFVGWEVIEADPGLLETSSLGGVDETASLQGASAAIRVGNEIWVSSTSNWIAHFPLSD